MPCTFPFLFLLFVVRLLPSNQAPINDDVLGLIVLKSDLNDPAGKLSSWNEDDDSPCGWVGIQCNPRSNRVARVSLDGFDLSGRVGRGLLQLQFLEEVSLARNNLTGNIPTGLSSLKNLRVVDFGSNGLSGDLTEFFRNCGGLRSVSLGGNMFQGAIPDAVGSCRSVAYLDLSRNRFSGGFPSGLLHVTGLRSLDLSFNSFTGDIPGVISGLSELRSINLRGNMFTGSLSAIATCPLLEKIDLSRNSLSGSVPNEMGKLGFCSSLILGNNLLTGTVPTWIGDMGSLQILDLSGNNLSGSFPDSICASRSLKEMNLSRNSLTGNPTKLSDCGTLETIDLSGNQLTGELPFFNSTPNIRTLDLSSNRFSGGIDPSVVGLKNLRVLDLSKNSLSGTIPEGIGGASSLEDLRLSGNSLTGKIPDSIGNCSSLTRLMLESNNLSGSVPTSLSRLKNLKFVDLSSNDLTGTLPKELGELNSLSLFNVSHNRLQGELPGSGFFDTISPSSVSDNPSLCGAVASKSCPAILPKPIVLNPNSSSELSSDPLPESTGHKRIILSLSALIAISAAATIVIGVIAVTVLNLRVRSAAPQSAPTLGFSNGDDFSNGSRTTDANSGKLVMFRGEDFSAGAHALLNKDCELGRGGFGAVYRAVLRDGRAVAIKKLTVSSLVKSQEDFEREVKKLGGIRHNNLVGLNGFYWTQSLQLLIYDYVSAGNLKFRIHEGSSHNILTWNDRFDVVLSVAKGLAHLHKHNIIHYNIKSSNVLISERGEAKLGDYGLAKLLPILDRYVLSSKIQSALGYTAPELSCGAVKISEKCDVYGFGALVLEVVTGRMPVEYMEDDVVVLCDVVRSALENGTSEDCVDGRLGGCFPAEEAVPVMKLGLVCTSQVPSSRPDMTEVVKILELIRYPEGESP